MTYQTQIDFVHTKENRKILAIKNKIRKGKVKNPEPAKNKIKEIRQRISLNDWLAQ